MSKKVYVITVSTVFPKGHPREGEETGFVEKLIRGEKIHTIRGNYEYWKKVSEAVNAGTHVLSFRTWNGVPYRSGQTEFLELSSFEVEKIAITKIVPRVFTPKNMSLHFGDVCHNDGLSEEDFHNWFFPPKSKHEIVKAAMLHFTDFRY